MPKRIHDRYHPPGPGVMALCLAGWRGQAGRPRLSGPLLLLVRAFPASFGSEKAFLARQLARIRGGRDFPRCPTGGGASGAAAANRGSWS